MSEESNDIYEPRTYEYLQTPSGEAIKCLRCGLVSFNQHDIDEMYCGNCHSFHRFTMPGAKTISAQNQ